MRKEAYAAVPFKLICSLTFKNLNDRTKWLLLLVLGKNQKSPNAEDYYNNVFEVPHSYIKSCGIEENISAGIQEIVNAGILEVVRQGTVGTRSLYKLSPKWKNNKNYLG